MASSSTLARIEILLQQVKELQIGMTCAQKIMERPGFTHEAKLSAVADVLRVAAARADGGDAAVSEETAKVMRVIYTDAEVRILWDRLGLKEWRPA